MSLERELLQRCLDEFEYKGVACNELCIDINKLLAQPEHTEQEPVAWMSLSDIEWMNIVNSPKILELTDGRHNSEEAVNLAVKMTEEKCKKNNSDSIPKREPLSDLRIRTANRNEYFEWGVRFAEKAHGIGGGE